jgi:carbon storage regulator CsrA
MLILTRRKSEKIRITDDVIITLNDIKGKQVSLGITAPKDKSITRGNNIYPKKEIIIAPKEKEVKILFKKSRLKKDK